MSIKQKLVVLLILFWISFFFESLLLIFCFLSFFAFVLKKDICLSLFLLLWLLILIINQKTTPLYDSSIPFCGKIDQVKNDYALLKNNESQIALFSEVSFTYFDEVCVKGTYEKHQPSSNFFNNPIETWVTTNNHVGSLNDIEIISHKKSDSLKGRLYEKAKHYKDNEVLLGMIFNHSLMQNTFFSMLLLSSGLQYTYTLQFFHKILSKFLVKHQRSMIILILWVLFGYSWGFSFVWWRVFLCNVCVLFLKDKNYGIVFSYGLLLIAFPKMFNHVAFVFPMFFQLFLRHNQFSKIQRFSMILIIQHVYLYSSNLLTILFFSLFRHVSGLLYIFSWIALLLKGFYPLYQKITTIVFSLPPIDPSILYGKMFGSVAFLICLFIGSKSLESKKMKKVGYSLLMLCLLSFTYPLYDLIVFVNVGQADATIIRKAFNQGSLLVDSAKESDHVILSQTTKGLGIKKLDGILITHDDQDHAGGLDRMKQMYPHAIIAQDKRDLLIKQLYFQALNKNYTGINDNDNSVVGLVEVGSLRYLLLGDLQKEGERYLVNEYPNLVVDVVKLGHHGSKTSTSNDLISSTRPQFAIISAKKSVYNHPHDEVLKTLFDFQVIPLDTNTVGDIAFISIFDWQFVLTSSGLFGIIK